MKREWLIENLGESWTNRLFTYLQSEEFSRLGNTIAEFRKIKSVYPEQKNVFKALQLCSFGDVKVVILGQDPYYTKDVADGLAFSCSYAQELGKRMQPSLVQIYGAVERTMYKGLMLHKEPNLECWAKQGVLLLNTALTVEDGKPESHLSLWKPFTVEVLKALSEYNTGVIYCLWGAKAQQYEKYINPKFNYILKAKHPSSASYTGGTWECNHFVEINKILKQNNNTEIIW
jgi:uracil-DNA glycosylase